MCLSDRQISPIALATDWTENLQPASAIIVVRPLVIEWQMSAANIIYNKKKAY